MNPYEILGVASDCDAEFLKKRYRLLVRENHPDLARTDSQRAESGRKMGEINRAWAILGDPQKRAAFDARQKLEAAEASARAQSRPQNPRPAPAKPAPATKPTTPTKKTARAAKKTERKAEKNARDDAKNTRPLPVAQLARAVQLFYEEGRADEAAALCHRVLRLDFKNVGARQLLADIHIGRGELPKAALLWEQIVMLRPDKPEYRARHQKLRALVEKATPPRPAPPRPQNASHKAPPASAASSSVDWNQVPIVTPIPSAPTPKPRGLLGKLRAKLQPTKSKS